MSTDLPGDISPGATKSDLAELQHALASAHRALLDEVERFAPTQWHLSPKDGSWTAAEIVEHILLSQQVLLEQIVSHLHDNPRPELADTMEI